MFARNYHPSDNVNKPITCIPVNVTKGSVFVIETVLRSHKYDSISADFEVSKSSKDRASTMYGLHRL